jgi:Fe-S cluster biogenesis protein NfuA
MIQQHELQQQLHRVEELILTLEKNADPASRAVARELVQLLLELHGAGLERMLEITSESGALGNEIIDRFGQDELARSLLLLHGLHPLDLASRVAEGLDSIRPYLSSRNAGVELVSITDGAVRTRLIGSAHGCTASSLKSAIEEALAKAAPDLISITVDVEPEPAASVFVPLASLRTFNGSAQHT